ncbi:hypothetical protein FKM82_023953 [Ascaphus truei]
MQAPLSAGPTPPSAGPSSVHVRGPGRGLVGPRLRRVLRPGISRVTPGRARRRQQLVKSRGGGCLRGAQAGRRVGRSRGLSCRGWARRVRSGRVSRGPVRVTRVRVVSGGAARVRGLGRILQAGALLSAMLEVPAGVRGVTEPARRV